MLVGGFKTLRLFPCINDFKRLVEVLHVHACKSTENKPKIVQGKIKARICNFTFSLETRVYPETPDSIDYLPDEQWANIMTSATMQPLKSD